MSSPIRRRSIFWISSTTLIQIEVDGPEHLPAAEREQLTGKRRRLFAGAPNLHNPFVHRRARCLLRFCHRGKPDDRGQQIVEVVSDAAGKLAHRLHLLSLSQFLLEAPALRHIAADGLNGDWNAVATLYPAGHLEDYSVPIGGDHRDLSPVGGQIGLATCEHRCRVLPRLGCDQIQERTTHERLARVAGEIEASLIDRHDAAVKVARADQVARVLDELTITQLAVAQRHLGVPAFGDVSQQHDVTREPFAMRPNRRDAHVMNAIAARAQEREVQSHLDVSVRRPAGQDPLDEFTRGAGAAAADDRFSSPVQIGDTTRAVQNENAVTNHLDARIAQRRDRFEHSVTEYGDCRDHRRAGEKKGSEVDRARGFAAGHEDQVANPRQNSGQHQNDGALAIQIRRLDSLADEDRQPCEEHAVGVDDIQPESRSAARQRVQRACRVDGHLAPEQSVPVVGPGGQQRDDRDHRHPASHPPHDPRLGCDKVQDEAKPRDRQRDDAEIFEFEREQFLSGITNSELQRVRGTPECDGQQQRAVPGRTADMAMPEGID